LFFDFLTAKNQKEEMNKEPAINPMYEWIFLNNLDGSLRFRNMVIDVSDANLESFFYRRPLSVLYKHISTAMRTINPLLSFILNVQCRYTQGCNFLFLKVSEI